MNMLCGVMMKNLKELRKKRNLSQLRLAMELGLSQQTIHKYESGKAEPDISTLIALARFFHVSVDYLIGYEYDTNTSGRNRSKSKKTPANPEITIPVTPDEYHYLSLYRQLHMQTRSAVNHILEAL